MYKSQIKSQWSVSEYETKALWRVGWRKGLPTSTHGASNKNWLASQLQIKETNSVELTVTVGQGNNVFAPPPPPKKKKSISYYGPQRSN